MLTNKQHSLYKRYVSELLGEVFTCRDLTIFEVSVPNRKKKTKPLQ